MLNVTVTVLTYYPVTYFLSSVKYSLKYECFILCFVIAHLACEAKATTSETSQIHFFIGPDLCTGLVYRSICGGFQQQVYQRK